MLTKRPSRDWKGFGDLHPGPGSLYERIQCVLSTVNLQELEKAALLARTDQSKTALDADLSCSIDPSLFTYGFNNVVLEISLSDHVYWIAKIQHTVVDASEVENNVTDLLSEIATMKTVQERTSIPVPRVYAYDISSSNKVGYPYILMEQINGRILKGSLPLEVPHEYWPKVAGHIADVLFQLHELSFDRLGRLWRGADCDGPLEVIPLSPDNSSASSSTPLTSLEWFDMNRENVNRQALELHPNDEQWRAACHILETAVPRIIVEAAMHGPFPLCHVDLHSGNLLLDDDYNLRGVIDWNQAQTVPVERLAVFPETSAFSTGPDDDSRKVLGLKYHIWKHLRCLEESRSSTSSPIVLSSIFGTKRIEVAQRCAQTLPHRALWDGRLLAGLLFGPTASWQQLVHEHGETGMI
ncbi:kinase-like domain-containing protein [Nemania sp. FL0916]|nr:kinase-like domain-containing protein [Nemania sp. FL0916]